jgi:hypothetical protein
MYVTQSPFSHPLDPTSESLFSSKTENRKFTLLKGGLHDDPESFLSHLFQYLDESGTEGFEKVFADRDILEFLSKDTDAWFEFMVERFPTKIDWMEESFYPDTLSNASSESTEIVGLDTQGVKELFDEIQANPKAIGPLLTCFFADNGSGRLVAFFNDPEFAKLLTQDEEFPWVEEVITAFPEVSAIVEMHISKLWLSRPDLENWLSKKIPWMDILAENLGQTTPLLFLSGLVRKNLNQADIDPDVVHSLLLDEKFQTILHADIRYPWISVYLSSRDKHIHYVEAFLIKKWRNNPDLLNIVLQNPSWMRALFHFSKESTPFLFLISVLRNRFDISRLGPEKIRQCMFFLPKWIVEQCVDIPSPSTGVPTNFKEVLGALIERTSRLSFSLDENLEKDWIQFVSSLNPITLFLIAQDEGALENCHYWIPCLNQNMMRLMVPLFEPACFRIFLDTLPLEKHNSILILATQSQRDFYCRDYSYPLEKKISEFWDSEQNCDAMRRFILDKIGTLQRIETQLQSDFRRVVDQIELLEDYLDQLQSGVFTPCHRVKAVESKEVEDFLPLQDLQEELLTESPRQRSSEGSEALQPLVPKLDFSRLPLMQLTRFP